MHAKNIKYVISYKFIYLLFFNLSTSVHIRGRSITSAGEPCVLESTSMGEYVEDLLHGIHMIDDLSDMELPCFIELPYFVELPCFVELPV